MGRVPSKHRRYRRPHGSFQPKPDAAQIGRRLTEARIKAGFMSAAEAAREIGISVTTYQHHENGRRVISPRIAALYAKAFNTTAAHIMFGSELLRETCVAIVGHIVERGMIVAVETDETVPVPEGIANVSNLKALRVETRDCWPAYQPGDAVFYDPGDLRRPVHGDVVVGQDCVVMTPLGTLMVRHVQSWSDGKAVLMAYKDGHEESVRILAASPVRIVVKNIQLRTRRENDGSPCRAPQPVG